MLKSVRRSRLLFLMMIPGVLFWSLPSLATASIATRLRVGVVVSPPFVNASIKTIESNSTISQPKETLLTPSSESFPVEQKPTSSPLGKKVELSGIVIDIWETLVDFNKLEYDYYQVASVDQGIKDVAARKIDVLIGPISITPQRLELVEFTQPYLNSYLAVLVRQGTPTLWSFVQPFLHKAAIALILVFLFIHILFSNLLWLAEHRKNSHQFPTKYWDGIAESLWFISVTMTTVGYGDKVPITHLGRFIAFIWMWLSLVLTTTITAGLATTLTLSFSQEINTKYNSISDLHHVKVSTVKSLALENIIRENNLETIEMPTLTDAINIFLLHEVEAVLSSENALHYFLRTHPNKSLKVLPFYSSPINYGFAVAPDSPYLNRLNIGIAQMVEDEVIIRIVNKWIR